MNQLLLYQVVGKRDYRGHAPGTAFPARLEPRAANRAIMRGSIVALREVDLTPRHFIFPRGWLPEDHNARKEA